MLKKRLLAGLLAALFLMAPCTAMAAEQTTSQTETTQQAAPSITEVYPISSTTVGLTLQCKDWKKYRFSLYRADKPESEGGKFKLLDTFYYPKAMLWYVIDEEKDLKSTDGAEGKSAWICMGDETDTLYIEDLSAELGKTFYYKLKIEGGLEKQMVYECNTCGIILYTYEEYENHLWSEDHSCSTTYIEVPGTYSAETNVVSAETILPAPEITQGYSKDRKSVTIRWTAQKDAKGYRIYCKTEEGWKRVKTITKNSTNKCTLKGLSANKMYKYKIRAYTKAHGKTIYSEYSPVYKVSTKKPTVKGSYKAGSAYGGWLDSSQLKVIRAVVQSFKTNHIRSDMSDYEKVEKAFQYIRANCDYDADAGAHYYDAYGGLVRGKGQCTGYSYGIKALCDGIGIPCRVVQANSQAVNPNHVWNMVQVDGKWYTLDAQVGYFLIGATTTERIGMKWNTGSYPKCNAKDHRKSYTTIVELSF